MSNIIDCIIDIQRARQANDNALLNSLVSSAFEVVVRTNSIHELRKSLPEWWDFEIPTRLTFAIHVQILQCPGCDAEDKVKFAKFLNFYYEEWVEWAAAIYKATNSET